MEQNDIGILKKKHRIQIFGTWKTGDTGIFCSLISRPEKCKKNILEPHIPIYDQGLLPRDDDGKFPRCIGYYLFWKMTLSWKEGQLRSVLGFFSPLSKGGQPLQYTLCEMLYQHAISLAPPSTPGCLALTSLNSNLIFIVKIAITAMGRGRKV